VVRSSARPSGASFGSPATLSGPAGAGTFGPAIAFDPSGAATAIWGGPFAGSPPDRIQVAARPPGVNQAFGAVDPISGPPLTEVNNDSPAIAFDDEGNAIAVWEHVISASPGVKVQYAGLDAAPPQIDSVSAPSGVAGQPISMSAAASDRWSPFSLSWSFGDGGSASGASVSYTYASAGSYTVTVKATDAAGNESQQTRTIQIASAPTSHPQPRTPGKPKKCRKGFRKKKVKGKTRCVKVKKKHTHKGMH
jgi:chitodextrinase